MRTARGDQRAARTRRALTRRQLLATTAAGLAGAAAGAGTFGDLVASIAVAAAPPKPKVLNVGVVAGVETRGLRAIAPLWSRTTGIQLNLIEYPYASLYETLTTAMQARAATFDLVMLDDPWMPKFAAAGWLTPLDASPFNMPRDPDIASVAYDLGTWPPPIGPVPPGQAGKPRHLYALSVVGNVELFMYRKDIAPLPPQTWDQVLANGTTFQNQGHQFYGYAIRGAKGNPIMADWFPMLRAFGGDVFDGQWNVIFNSSETINAVKFLGGQLLAIAQPGPDTTDATDRSRLIATGHALESTVWPAEASAIVENPQVSTMAHKIGYTVMPMGAAGRHTPMLGHWLLGIPQAAQQKEWSYRFITWATSAAVQRAYAAAGGIPSRKSILTDPALVQRYPFFPAISASLAVPPFWRPRTPEWPAVEVILGTHVNAALAGTESPEQAVTRGAADTMQHMQQAGYIK